MIIDHMSLGVVDIERAMAFYDAVMPAIGAKRQHTVPGQAAAYGREFPCFWIGQPAPEAGAFSPGGGLHVCVNCNSPAAVDAFYAACLDNGGQDNGAPGLRTLYTPNYYGAFVLDTEGNRIGVVCYCSEEQMAEVAASSQ